MAKMILLTLGILVFMLGCLIRGEIADSDVTWQLTTATALGVVAIIVAAYLPR